MGDQDTLFHVPVPEQHRPTRKRWGGAASAKARAKCRAMLPAPCHRCGGIIRPEDDPKTWQAGHLMDRVDTEALGIPDADVAPEHTTCNTSSGGKRGAAITNQRHSQDAYGAPAHRDKEPQWW